MGHKGDAILFEKGVKQSQLVLLLLLLWLHLEPHNKLSSSHWTFRAHSNTTNVFNNYFFQLRY